MGRRGEELRTPSRSKPMTQVILGCMLQFLHRSCSKKTDQCKASSFQHGCSLDENNLLSWLVIFFSLTEAPLTDPTPTPPNTPETGPETDPERTRNGPETEPNGAERSRTEPNGAKMDRNQALSGGTDGGVCREGGGGGGGCKGKRISLLLAHSVLLRLVKSCELSSTSPGTLQGGDPREAGKNYTIPLPGLTPENGEDCPENGGTYSKSKTFVVFPHFSPVSEVRLGWGILSLDHYYFF